MWGWGIAKQIWSLLEFDWRDRISHIYRKANKVADGMANFGCDLDELLVPFDHPSHPEEPLVFVDFLGSVWFKERERKKWE